MGACESKGMHVMKQVRIREVKNPCLSSEEICAGLCCGMCVGLLWQ